MRALLESGQGETVKPGDPRLQGSDARMITALLQIALEAAAQVARAAGITPYILGDSLNGEARDVAKVLAGETDGVDGIEEIAGALLTPGTIVRGWAVGMNPRSVLDDNDAHSFFQNLGDSVVTGPTLTDVNDFRAILVGV